MDDLINNYCTKSDAEEKLYEKANSINTTHTGRMITTSDSANTKPENIILYGDSLQKKL